MKDEHIVSFSAQQIRSLVSGGTDSDWDRIDTFTEDDIERMAKEENAQLGIPDDWYKDAVAVYPNTESESRLEVIQSAMLRFLAEVGIPAKEGSTYQSTRPTYVVKTFAYST